MTFRKTCHGVQILSCSSEGLSFRGNKDSQGTLGLVAVRGKIHRCPSLGTSQDSVSVAPSRQKWGEAHFSRCWLDPEPYGPSRCTLREGRKGLGKRVEGAGGEWHECRPASRLELGGLVKS